MVSKSYTKSVWNHILCNRRQQEYIVVLLTNTARYAKPYLYVTNALFVVWLDENVFEFIEAFEIMFFGD